MAKDAIASQDALIAIFEQIGNIFKRLEEYAEVPMTEAVKEIVVKIMADVLEMFAIMTKELKEGRSSESSFDVTSLVADRGSERYHKKFLKKLIGRKGIEDVLNRLDGLAQEAVEIMKVTGTEEEKRWWFFSSLSWPRLNGDDCRTPYD